MASKGAVCFSKETALLAETIVDVSGQNCPSHCMLAIAGSRRPSLLLQTASSSLTELPSMSRNAGSYLRSSTIAICAMATKGATGAGGTYSATLSLMLN